jgi:uncharacterized repeat protein (TIGR01451 family)
MGGGRMASRGGGGARRRDLPSRRLRSPATLLVALGLLLGPVPPATAQVLTTITIDGQMGDWAAVLADPYQAANDGPAGALPDLDAPVQSTGRDLNTFAWTYDGSYLYFYVRREASSSNRQLFWFYLDTNENGLLESGEPVVGVSWWGSNRRTLVELHSYQPAAPGGDPLGDPGGLADGWTMPGTVAYAGQLENVKGGAPNGVEMESRVSWSTLGVPAGTPVGFHVSASNSANIPIQIDDNMGGPGGAVGSTRIAGVSIVPDGAADVVPGGDAVLAHTVTNTGASPDAFNLTWTSAGDFAPGSVSYFHDANGDGLRDPGDTVLGDTDGDGVPDTGTVAAGASFAILAVITAPLGVANGQSSSVVTTASSSGVPAVIDTVTDLVSVSAPSVTLVKSVDLATAAPGDILTYTVDYTSNGVAEAYNVVVVDPVPPDTEYVAGSAAGPGTAIEFSHDGGVSFDASESAPVTHIRWLVLTPLAPGTSGTVSFQVAVR